MRAPAPLRMLFLALPLAASACNICGPDKRSLLSYADAGLTVARGAGAPTALTLNGALWEEHTDPAVFQELWDVFTRAREPYPAAKVTLTGGSSSQLAGLVLALPTPVRSGQHLVVGGAFPPPSEPYVMYWSVWGRHTPATAGRAELGLRLSDFSPTGGPSNAFVATDASGTIDVAEVEDDTFRLQLDVKARNAAGETVQLRGPVVVRAQSESAQCFS